jgi:hypothetical protein
MRQRTFVRKTVNPAAVVDAASLGVPPNARLMYPQKFAMATGMLGPAGGGIRVDTRACGVSGTLFFSPCSS